MPKTRFSGRVIGVQPRIRLLRSFDQRSHSYLGYLLRIVGHLGGADGEFLVAVGPAAHRTQQFRTGDEISGEGVPPSVPETEIASLHKVSGLRIRNRGPEPAPTGPPFTLLAPDLPTYRARGHRRLSEQRYEETCRTCTWGCRMPVEMIVDQWNPSKVKHRTEAFCYGPLSCRAYLSGPKRRVPGRKPGMTWVEDDWIDEDATSHRKADE